MSDVHMDDRYGLVNISVQLDAKGDVYQNTLTVLENTSWMEFRKALAKVFCRRPEDLQLNISEDLWNSIGLSEVMQQLGGKSNPIRATEVPVRVRTKRTREPPLVEMPSPSSEDSDIQEITEDAFLDRSQRKRENLKLGHFFPSRERLQYGLDTYSPNLWMFSKTIDTPQMEEIICKIYHHLLQGDENRYIRTLLRATAVGSVSKDQFLASIVNVVHGRTQMGKSHFITAVTYLCALALGHVPVIFVRSVGGLFTKESLEESIQHLAAKVIKFVSIDRACRDRIESGAGIPGFTLATVTHFLKPEIVWASDPATFRTVASGPICDRYRPLIIIGRQNKACVEKIFVARPTGRAPHESLPTMLQSSQIPGMTRQFALICDEDDTTATSGARSKGQCEHINFVFKVDEFKSPVDSASELESESETEDEEPSDTLNDDDEASNLSAPSTAGRGERYTTRQILSHPTVRGSSQLVIAISATPYGIVALDPQFHRQVPNMIDMPVPVDYIGIDVQGELAKCKQRVEIVDVEEDGDRTRPAVEQLGCRAMMRDLQKKYEEIVNLPPNDTEPRQRHISVLINTTKTNEKLDQRTAAEDLIKDQEFGHLPLITFAYNSQIGHFDILISKQLTKHCPSDPVALLTRVTRRAVEKVSRRAPSRKGEQAEPAADWLLIRNEGSMYRLSVNLMPQCRIIKFLYDVIYAVFNELHVPPFVVCFAGLITGRQVTLKDSKHRYVLTDMFMTRNPGTHVETLVQLVGRICSRDEHHHIPRRLWIPSATYYLVQESLGFTLDFVKLACDKPYVQFQDLCDNITKKYPGVIRAIETGLKRTRPALDRETISMMNHLPKGVESDPMRGEPNQANAIFELLKNRPDNTVFLRAMDIWKALGEQGLVRRYPADGEDPQAVYNKLYEQDPRTAHLYFITQDNERDDAALHPTLGHNHKNSNPRFLHKGEGRDGTWNWNKDYVHPKRKAKLGAQ